MATPLGCDVVVPNSISTPPELGERDYELAA